MLISMGLQIHCLLALEDFVQLHTDLLWSNSFVQHIGMACADREIILH